MASFGSPGGASKHFKPTPPQKGSFPLDHYAECKSFMTAYLNCIKSSKAVGEPCRPLARSYLECRMEKGLMAKEEMDHLGFFDDDKKSNSTSATSK